MGLIKNFFAAIGAGTTINRDSLIVEIIRRIRERGNGSGGSLTPDLDLLNKLRVGGEGAAFDPELYKELIKK